MIEQEIITHHIQKHILRVLIRCRVARFRDLRLTGVDTNLFTYHLKLLQRARFIEKVDGGYTLASKGLAYVDRVNAEQLVVRPQPKIITMLVVQNSDGDVLVQRRAKQPYIDTWTLPYGKSHLDDSSVTAAMRRESSEKLSLAADPVHAGDCYIRVMRAGELISSTLVHVGRFENDEIEVTDGLMWVRPHKLHQLPLAPAVQEIMTRTFFRDPFYFEEFTIDLASSPTIAA